MNAVFRPHTNAGTAVPELQEACGTYCSQPFDREALYGRHDQEQRRLAVIDVIDTCIENDILVDVLREHRDEVI